MKTNTICWLIGLFVMYILGLAVGYHYSKDIPEDVVTSVKTDTLPPIHDTIFKPSPCKTIVDTMYKYREIDTAEILADYYAKREYKLDFSNDSAGVYKVNLDISENRVINAVSEIRPIRITVETIKYVREPKKAQIYAVLGTSVDFTTNKVQVGTDIGSKYIIGASAVRVRDNIGYTVDFGIKF